MTSPAWMARDYEPPEPKPFDPDACPDCAGEMWHYKGSAWTCALGHRVHRTAPNKPALRSVPDVPPAKVDVIAVTPTAHEWWVPLVPYAPVTGAAFLGALFGRLVFG